jgi:K+-transporting ATPase ATPase B chain
VTTRVKTAAPRPKSRLFQAQSLFNIKSSLYHRTIIETLIKLDPKQQVRNPAMFMVSVATVVTTALFAWLLSTRSEELSLVIGTLSVSMGLIVLSTYFAQALAGVRSQIRAETNTTSSRPRA